MHLRHSALILFLITLAGCATVDFDYPRDVSVAIDPTEDTTLKRRVDDWLATNPGPSGFYPLISGTDALGARLRMIEVAEKTIDAQYFLMKTDAAGYNDAPAARPQSRFETGSGLERTNSETTRLAHGRIV